MEKKSRTEYNTEYVRKKRGSITRQERGGVLENTLRIEIRLKEELAHPLKELAHKKGIGVNQLLRDIITEYLDKEK